MLSWVTNMNRFSSLKKILWSLKIELQLLKTAGFCVCSLQVVTNHLGVVIPHAAGNIWSCLEKLYVTSPITYCAFTIKLFFRSPSAVHSITAAFLSRSGWLLSQKDSNCTISGNLSSSFPRSFGATNCLPRVITAVFTKEVLWDVVRILWLPSPFHLDNLQSPDHAYLSWAISSSTQQLQLDFQFFSLPLTTSDNQHRFIYETVLVVNCGLVPFELTLNIRL